MKNKTNKYIKSKGKSRNKNINKTRSKTKTRSKKMKGGAFSDFFSVWDTMTYNLSNALSTFSITPPPAVGNVSEPVNPSVSKQFL